MGYCRGAKVTVTDVTPQSPHAAWQFVVSNDEHATLRSKDTPPPDWIQPGVMVRIEVEPPRGQESDAAIRASPNQLKSPDTLITTSMDLVENEKSPIKPRLPNAPKLPKPPDRSLVSSTDLAEMRRSLIRILNKIEEQRPHRPPSRLALASGDWVVLGAYRGRSSHG
jgi:hypothetical protein